MQVKNTSACILLFLTVWELILPVKSKQIKCEPGKTLEKIQNVFDCVPCPPGTFSKGNNSVCRPCKKCHKKRVKKKCTATHNTVCKGAHSCTSYWKRKNVNYLMKYCWFTRCKTQSGKCVAQKDRTPDRPIQRTKTLSRSEPTPTSSHRQITSQDLGNMDADNLPRHGHIAHVILGTLGTATALILITFIFFVVKMRIDKRKSRLNIAHKYSESDQKSVFETVVLLDTTQTKSRTTSLSETRFQDVSCNVDKRHAYIKPVMHVRNVKSLTNDCQQTCMVQPSHRTHVIQNEYTPFPAHGAAEKDNHTNCSVNEAYNKRSHVSSVSSGCSDMSRHGQRVESDDDSMWCSDQSWTNEPEAVKIVDTTSKQPDHRSSTNSEVCQIPAADVTEECQIQKSPLLLLDTVVPICKEAVLKPKEATCVDLQKHVKSCDQDKLEPFWSHGEVGNSDVTTDHGQQGLNTAATSTDENDDDRWLEFLNSRKETNDGTTALLSALQQINCNSSCSRDAIARDSGGDSCSQRKQTSAGDGGAGALGEPKHIENHANSLEMGSPSKPLNNWTYHPYFTETSLTHDREKESECVFGSNTENSTGNISDRSSIDMAASGSGSTSTASSSDELSWSSPSPSSTPEPVTYVTIHNIYEVKDSNKTANIHGETQVLAIDSAAVPDTNVPSASYVTDDHQNSEGIRSDPETGRLDTCSLAQVAGSQQCHQDHTPIQHESERHPVTQDRFNTTIVNSKKTSYEKVKQCNPENLHETLHKTEGTQTHHNCENMQTIFGQKWDVKKYFSSKGGQLSKSTTNMSLTVFENSISEGETVLVGGRFTGNFLDVLPYLDEGWVVISPLAEFQMAYRKRWDKHVKIYIPYYPHNPKEILRVCFYHRTEKGDIQHGDVPPFDDSKNQDMYFMQKADHVEIYTVTFTLFHCACDHVFPLFLTSLVFTSYNKNENEALVRVHVGDTRLEDPLISKEIEDKERQQHGTMLNQSKPVRLLQCEEFAGDTRLVFKIDFPPKRGQGRTASDTASTSWENLFPENCPQIQERRFCELVKCMCQCKSEGKMATKCVSTRHDCREEIEWTFTSTADPCPDQFPCTIAITHELPVGQEADRHGACQEGVTWYRLKTPHRDPSTLEKLAPTHQEFALRELPSAWNNEDPYCGL